jgi:hypothetical protein
MIDRRRRKPLLPTALCAALLLGAPTAGLGQAEPAGLIDGAPLAALAGPDDELVEVNLRQPLLRAAAAAAAADPELAKMIAGLERIQLITLATDDPAKADRALAFAENLSRSLGGDGWQTVARIQDGSDLVRIHARSAGEQVEALTILVVGSAGSEVVFLNIVGDVDMAKLGALGAQFGLPQLAPPPEGAP